MFYKYGIFRRKSLHKPHFLFKVCPNVCDFTICRVKISFRKYECMYNFLWACCCLISCVQWKVDNCYLKFETDLVSVLMAHTSHIQRVSLLDAKGVYIWEWKFNFRKDMTPKYCVQCKVGNCHWNTCHVVETWVWGRSNICFDGTHFFVETSIFSLISFSLPLKLSLNDLSKVFLKKSCGGVFH